MRDIQQVHLNFSGDAALESADRLEGILFSGGWGNRGLNYKDEHTRLLLRLLASGGITVYKRPYAGRDSSPELRQKAMEINLFMRKRDVSGTLLDIAGIFAGHEYDSAKTRFNSLFFHDMKAFVRCGNLPPDRLLELLEQDGCDAVFLFSDEQSDDGDCFYAFIRAMPRELFLEALTDMKAQITEAISEALQKAEDN